LTTVRAAIHRASAMDRADDAAAEPGPVFQLIYRSRSLIAPGQRKAGLGDVFTTARRNNRRLGVTGALMISDDAFVQVLEGDEAVVRKLYGTICEDARHQDVTLLRDEVVEDRRFGRWAMAQVAQDGGADIRLLSNATKGVIVAIPGSDRSVTTEQHAVLTFMRRSLAVDHA
jgi:hypothetical protein